MPRLTGNLYGLCDEGSGKRGRRRKRPYGKRVYIRLCRENFVIINECSVYKFKCLVVGGKTVRNKGRDE